jgi:hypothetical protein
VSSGGPSAPFEQGGGRTTPARRRWVTVLGGVTLVVLLMGGLVANDVRVVHGQLIAAETEVEAAREALGQGDTDAAAARLLAARRSVEKAERRTGRFLWLAGERVPVVGRSVDTVGRITDLARAATELGRTVVRDAEGVIGRGGRMGLSVDDGRLDLGPVHAVGEALRQTRLDPLVAARDRLAATPRAWVPAGVVSGREDALELAEATINTVETARGITGAIPTFLGADGPRRYLLAMQNPAELRGTGGLIGFYAVLEADDGRLRMSEPRTYGVLDRATDEPAEHYRPVTTTEEFAARYAGFRSAGFMANVNMDPDLPTTARVLLDLYALRTTEALDGVVVVDPVGLGMLLEAVGPVRVPSGVADPAIPNPLAPGDVARVTMVDLYDAFDGRNDARREYLSAFATAAFGRIFSGTWDPVAVGNQLAAAAAGGHLQVHSEAPDEQASFVELGISGSFAAPEAERAEEDDLLALTGNNAGGNKADVHAGHALRGTITLSDVDGTTARRESRLEVEVDNRLPAEGHAEYISGIGSRPAPAADFTPARGMNRTWLTLWAPGASTIEGVRSTSDGERRFVGSAMHGYRTLDHFLVTPTMESRSFEAAVDGPVSLRRRGTDLVYGLTIWRQAKATPDRIDLRVEAPSGWEVVDMRVEGGGRGAGMGPFGEPGPVLEASVDAAASTVHLRGDVDEHVRLEVRLGRPLLDRAAAWLRSPAF